MKKRGSQKGSQNSEKGSQKRFTLRTDANSKITSSQANVLKLYTQFYLTVKQIAQRRQTSTRAVYKILNRLAEKGLLQKDLKKGFTNPDRSPPKTIRNLIKKKQSPQHFIRLHLLQVHEKILYPSRKYQQVQQQIIKIDLYGNTVLLYRDSLEIYVSESASGEDEDRALMIGLYLLHKIETKLENLYHIILNKQGVTNKRIVNWHFSETDNEMAKDVNAKKEKYRFYSRQDGRLWFLIDDSWHLNELECVHPETAKDDMHTMRLFLNDLRENPMTFGRMQKNVMIPVSRTEKKIDAIMPVIERFSMNVELHLDVLTEMKDTLAEMRQEMMINRLKKDTENLREQVEKLRKDTQI